LNGNGGENEVAWDECASYETDDTESGDAGSNDVVWDDCRYDTPFSEMKTGDACISSSFGGCGRTDDSSAFSDPFSIDAMCFNDVLSVTELKVVQDEVRPDAIWKDCGALDYGRTGEKCEGQFACYKEICDGCLGGVVCRADDQPGSDQLLRISICDNNKGTNGSGSADDTIYTDCMDLQNARPLDMCSGEFVCREELYNNDNNVPVSRCEDNQEAFCPAYDIETLAFPRQIWCDGNTLHFFSNESAPISWILIPE
jgi:hypothetical protein